MKIIGVILLVIVIIVCIPLLTIWSINTLFLLGIPYTIKTWTASFVLGGIFYQSNNKK